MAKKGIAVWLFSSLTFISLAHLIDSLSTLLLNNPSKLLQLYPFVGEKLQTTEPIIYFLVSLLATFFLWGFTCATAFENPVETFLNNILSEAKKQSTVETQLSEEKSEILDAMNETIESNNEILSHVKDLIYNIRNEVKELQPLKENVEKMKTELSSLRKEIKTFEEKLKYQSVCPACGKAILAEFKICPYCGEDLKLIPEKLVVLEKYK